MWMTSSPTQNGKEAAAAKGGCTEDDGHFPANTASFGIATHMVVIPGGA